MINFREEMSGEETAIRDVNEQAFGRTEEAALVDAIRKRDAIALSMVAAENSRVVGHILFTPVTIKGADSEFQALGLGPVAVLPSHQHKGVGSELLRKGLDRCRKLGHEIIVVVGEPAFYSRFGFVAAKGKGIDCEFDVPDEVFMVLELRENALAGRAGVVYYQNEFRDV